MKIRSNFDVILLLLACLGAVAAIALVIVAALHGTRLDTMKERERPSSRLRLFLRLFRSSTGHGGRFRSLLLFARSRRGP